MFEYYTEELFHYYEVYDEDGYLVETVDNEEDAIRLAALYRGDYL